MSNKCNSFPKSERLCSKYDIDNLFLPGHSRSLTAYPMRLVYRLEKGDTNRLLISVPKKYFKHAVDRNHVKRQVREAYRTNRSLLKLPEGRSVNMAVIWIEQRLCDTAEVVHKMQGLLQRLSENVTFKDKGGKKDVADSLPTTDKQ